MSVVGAGFADRIFRSNPCFEVVLTDRLSPAERKVLEDLMHDPDVYGVLRPAPGSSQTMKAVSCDTALLLLTLREPGGLPGYVRRQGERCERQVVELVMDGILEVLDGERFISGPQAANLIGAAAVEEEALGALAQLSVDALIYAQSLELQDTRRLAARLYFFNRQPSSPRWERRFGDTDDVLAHIGVRSNNNLRSWLIANWGGAEPASVNEAWLVWTRDQVSRPANGAEPVYKLYLSPPVDALGEAFIALVEVLSRSRSTGFKIGANAAGLLRPDKLVAYFSRFDDIAAVVEPLSQRLDGVPAHGVPFTAEIAGEGLLSWGVDPPRVDGSIFESEGESWRLWVVNQLASALLAARREASIPMAPWQFALQRLALRGIDVTNWTPSMTLWTQPGSED